MPAIRATGVDKRFGAARAVDAASLEVASGELVALLGPSGSGKTTLLRIVAGFEVPDAGAVEIGGRVVAGPGRWEEPERRRVGMVFQDDALFPHLTVARNVGFGHPARGRVQECLELVGLAHRGSSYPHELSGGERQRVALARALAIDPAVVLLDEPFAALDAGLRASLREDVVAILRGAGASALMVTHDQEEALSLADRVVVMRDGRVEQAGAPQDLYERPASRWVAEFLGAAEILPGSASDGVVSCELGSVVTGTRARGDVELVLRPESVLISDHGGDPGAATAVVVRRSYFGHDQLVLLELPSGRRLHSRTSGALRWEPGTRVRIRACGPVHVLPGADVAVAAAAARPAPGP